jgi:hypothetical protein
MFMQVLYITSIACILVLIGQTLYFKNIVLISSCGKLLTKRLGAKVQLYINHFKSISYVLNKPSIWFLNYHPLSNFVSELQKYSK